VDPDEIDERVRSTTERVWASIDCKTCANSCRQVRPTVTDEEVSRLALRLGVNRQEFIEQYLEATEALGENPWQTRTLPCPFLKGNLCSVYDDRPADCQGYPYLHNEDFVSRTIAVIERTFTCPIVYEVMEELKKSFG